MRISKDRIQTIEQTAPFYPAEWKVLSDAPQRLYAIGDGSLLKERKLTVVGSRRTPAAALKTGAEIVKGVTSVFTVVTGSAGGGDSAAIEGALAADGKVICVLAGGFAAIPQGNLSLLERVAEKGLLLSPHEYDTPIRSFSYEYRNKLIALLGEGTLVLGAAEKSGALITARYAKEQGKRLFALPYAPNVAAGAGCNTLIKKGAYLTETAEDILQNFGIEMKNERPMVALSDEESRMLEALRTLSVGHITRLSTMANVPVFKARAVLSSLEVKGLCVSVGGNQYSPV